MKINISAIVLTFNEEKSIEDCLKSIYNLVDEVIVVDSYSTDKTVEISKYFTDKVFEHHFENFSQQRRWAQESLPLRNEWVFHLDADERVSPELASELKELFRPKPKADGLMIPRRTIFMGKWIKHGGHYPVYHTRIFKKHKGRCEDRLYDQHFCVDGHIEELNGDIINIITPDISTFISRHRKWAVFEASQAFYQQGIGIEPNVQGNKIEYRRWLRARYYDLPIFLRPCIYFIYRFFVRLGFLDGKEGFVFHFLQGFWFRFLVDVNIFKLRIKAQKK
ncbi:MAG: glycosyltransferase family 2 protein [Candidatus Omnitrophica bacterium]|nr:glycosyltransferase family 2 protein [Candidatus Omnitrophota bacterium]